MELETGLVLAEHDGAVSLRIGLAVAFAAGVAIVGLLGRRRLPAGLGEGTLVAGVSGGVVLLAVESTGGPIQTLLGHVLTGLAISWYALSRIGARRQPFGSGSRERNSQDKAKHERSQMLACAALVCGLAALVSCLVTPGGFTRAGWSPTAVDFLALLALSVLIRVFRTEAWAAYPAITLLVCLVVLAVPDEALDARAAPHGLAMNAVGAVSLVVVIGAVLLHWRRKRRWWLENPQRPLVPPPAHNALFVTLVGISLLVGIFGVLLREAAFTPTGVLLAGMTCLTIGHLRTWSVVSEIGLALIAESIVTASMAWVCEGWTGALFGLGVAAFYLLWLARFWDQQLDEGGPWTTAGRLIPGARRLAWATAAGAFGAALGEHLGLGYQVQPVWFSTVTAVVLLGTMGLMVRDAREHGVFGSGLAACLLMLAATLPAGRLIAGLVGEAVSPILVIAAGALLLALCAARTSRASPSVAVYNACIGGILPVLALLALSLGGIDAQSVAALALVVVAVVVRFVTFRAGPDAIRARRPGRA